MKKTIQEHRAEATLNKVFRYPEGVMSRREYMNYWRIKGATVEEKQIRDYDKEERVREELQRRRMDIPTGNPNYPSTAQWLKDKAELDAGIFRTEYRLNLPDGCLMVITKTEYEYFRNMELAEDKQTEANELDYKIEAGTATDQEIQEAEDKDIEFFRKYTN